MFSLSLLSRASTWSGFWPNHGELARPPFVSGPHPIKDWTLANCWCWPQWAPGEVSWGYGWWSRQGDPPHRALLLLPLPAHQRVRGGLVARLLNLAQEDRAHPSHSSCYHRRGMSLLALAVCPGAGPRIDWVIWCVAEARLIFPRYWVVKSVDLAGTQSREGRVLKKRCPTGYTMTTCIIAFRWSMAAAAGWKWELGECGFPRRAAAAAGS